MSWKNPEIKSNLAYMVTLPLPNQVHHTQSSFLTSTPVQNRQTGPFRVVTLKHLKKFKYETGIKLSRKFLKYSKLFLP